MIDVTLEDSTLRAVDAVGHTVAADVVGWDDSASPTTIPIEGLDTSVAGHVTSLTFGDVLVELGDSNGDDYEKLGEAKEAWTLDAEPRLMKVTSEVVVYVAFDAAAELSRLADGRVRLAFEHPTPVTLGYWSLVDYPEETVTVPPTAAGLATAITALSSAYLSTGPDRTLPGWRAYPPRVAFGDETDVPDAVREDVPDTGIELVLPAEFAYGIPAAPLAYHLGATVRVESRDAPVLRAPSVDLERSFPALPEFQFAANDAFQRTFYADSLVNSAHGSADLAESDFLADVALDPDALYDATPAERLAAYLEAPFESIRSRLPQRSYVGFVEPTPEYARALPHLCHYEARLYLPSAFDDVGDGADPSETAVWLADGCRPDTVTGAPAAFDNYLRYLESGLDPDGPEILVVGNATGDAASTMEGGDRVATVERGYREPDGVIDVDVASWDDPSTAELATAFGERRALMHVVGDAVDDGVRCRDGVLDLADVDAVESRIVVLDLADDGESGVHGREHASAIGRTLVDAGAVAVVVRTGVVDDAPRQAFSRLLVQAFGLELSRRLVDRYVDGAFDAVVVGDGTHTLQADDSVNFIPLEIVANGDTTFTVTGKAGGPTAGLFWHPDIPGVRPRLLANSLAFEVTAPELATVLDDPGYLVIYEDELHWSGELTPFYPIA